MLQAGYDWLQQQGVKDKMRLIILHGNKQLQNCKITITSQDHSLKTKPSHDGKNNLGLNSKLTKQTHWDRNMHHNIINQMTLHHKWTAVVTGVAAAPQRKTEGAPGA